MTHNGRCYCGAIHYQITGPLQAQFQCHCRECSYITGGGANLVAVVNDADFAFTKGTPKVFARSDLETPVQRYFCGACGTAFGSVSPSRPGAFIVKVGTLDDPSVFAPQAAIFTCDRQSYQAIPEGLPSFDKRPPKPAPSSQQ